MAECGVAITEVTGRHKASFSCQFPVSCLDSAGDERWLGRQGKAPWVPCASTIGVDSQ